MLRKDKLIGAMPESMDGILVTSELNIRWLCGFPYTDGYILVTRHKSYVITDFRYIEAAKAQVGPGFEIVMMQGSTAALITSLLEENGVKTLGFEDEEMSCAVFSRMQKNYPGVEFAPIGSLIADQREYKDESELADITAAQRIAEAAFDHILGYITPERTEQEVALELEYFMRQKGASGTSFETIAVSGSASSRPHGVPRDCKLEKGFLTMDFGALYNGYCSDMTRTVCIGRADDEMKRLYQTVLNAQLAAIDFIAPGVKCADCDKVARDIIDGAGYKGCFGHSLGHGVGMFIHESPRLSSGAGDKVLGKGHVVTVEPGIYLEGKYGVRIEDMMYIGDTDATLITNCPKQLIEL